MKASRVKELTEKNAKGREKKQKINLIIISLVSCIAMWAGLLFVANSIINEAKRVEVLQFVTDAPKGTKITSSNIYGYLKVASVPEDMLPNGYITEEHMSYLIDTFTTRDYQAKDIITSHGVSSEESMTSHIENPIETSIAVASIDAAVGGILREGDYINIYSVSSSSSYNNGSAKLIMSNAYVTKALDSSGKVVSRTEKDTNATVLNLIIPMSIEKQFNEELAAGTIRISLVYNPDLTNIKEKVEEAGDSDTEDTSRQSEEETEESIIGVLEAEDIIKDNNTLEKEGLENKYNGSVEYIVDGTVKSIVEHEDNCSIVLAEGSGHSVSIEATRDIIENERIDVGTSVEFKARVGVADGEVKIISYSELEVQ